MNADTVCPGDVYYKPISKSSDSKVCFYKQKQCHIFLSHLPKYENLLISIYDFSKE